MDKIKNNGGGGINSGQLKSLIQTTACSLLPILTMKYVNTGDRTLDNIMSTFITGFFGLLLVYIVNYDFSNILSKKLKHGFINDDNNLLVGDPKEFSLKETTIRPPIAISTSGILNLKAHHDLILWISQNTRLSSKPRIYLNISDGINYKSTSYNSLHMFYPFYYSMNSTMTDIIYYEFGSRNSAKVHLIFHSNNINSIKQFFNEAKQHIELGDKFDVDLIYQNASTDTDTFKTDVIYNQIMNWVFHVTDSNGTIVKHPMGSPTTIGRYKTNRTFEQLFFTEKERLVNLLEKFKTGTLYPNYIGSDNKMGICLHGHPGTGKSSVVVAIANFLNRGILNVDMSKIKTCEQFDKLLNYIDADKNLILFMDEIDCILGVLKARNISNGNSENSENENSDRNSDDVNEDKEYKHLMDMYINTHVPEQQKEILAKIEHHKDIKSNKLTLGYILQKLDGIDNTSERVIIACTNHHNLIDPALLRAGRLGISLNLSYCTKIMIIDILCFYLHIDIPNTDIPNDVIDRSYLNTLNYKSNISPADLIQCIQTNFINGGGIDNVLKQIISH